MASLILGSFFINCGVYKSTGNVDEIYGILWSELTVDLDTLTFTTTGDLNVWFEGCPPRGTLVSRDEVMYSEIRPVSPQLDQWGNEINYVGGTLYDLIPADAELQIIFPKAIAFSKDTKPQKKIAGKKIELKLPEISLAAATSLKTVTATALKNNVAVNVKADGPIKNYQLFTIDNPARIVFDMYNIKSPYKKEQIIVVESKWVKRIRHFGHPDRVRLVLDTNKESLSKYSAYPTDTGLLINVGKTSAVPDNASQIP